MFMLNHVAQLLYRGKERVFWSVGRYRPISDATNVCIDATNVCISVNRHSLETSVAASKRVEVSRTRGRISR